MFEVYTNFSIRIFLLATVHNDSTKLCSLHSSPQNFFSAGKYNPYYNVSQGLFEIVFKIILLKQKESYFSINVHLCN